MNEYGIYVALSMIILAALFGAAIGYFEGSTDITETRDSRDYRAMQLELADVKARLATLERIGVEIELNDRTGTWFVLNGKVQ